MLGDILQIIKAVKCKGKYTKIAMGQNKLPETFKEVYNHLKYLKK